jgi:hypothetical protein
MSVTMLAVFVADFADSILNLAGFLFKLACILFSKITRNLSHDLLDSAFDHVFGAFNAILVHDRLLSPDCDVCDECPGAG